MPLRADLSIISFQPKTFFNIFQTVKDFLSPEPPWFNKELSEQLRQFSTEEIEDKLKSRVFELHITPINLFRVEVIAVTKHGKSITFAKNKRNALIDCLDMICKLEKILISTPLYRSSFVKTS